MNKKYIKAVLLSTVMIASLALSSLGKTEEEVPRVTPGVEPGVALGKYTGEGHMDAGDCTMTVVKSEDGTTTLTTNLLKPGPVFTLEFYETIEGLAYYHAVSDQEGSVSMVLVVVVVDANGRPVDGFTVHERESENMRGVVLKQCLFPEIYSR